MDTTKLVVGQDVYMCDAICVAKGKVVEITSSCVGVQIYSALSNALTGKRLLFNEQGEHYDIRNEGGIMYLTDDEELARGYEQSMPERQREYGEG